MSSNKNRRADAIWQLVCKVGEIPQRGGRTIRTGAKEIAIFHLSDGRIRAVENRCPHKQGPLAEGIVSDDTIICPLHARKINLESGEVLPPDSGCVKTYPTRVEAGQIFLQL